MPDLPPADIRVAELRKTFRVPERVLSAVDGRINLKVAKADTSAVAVRLLAAFQVSDLTIEDPPIEEVIEQVFATSARNGTGGTATEGTAT